MVGRGNQPEIENTQNSRWDHHTRPKQIEITISVSYSVLTQSLFRISTQPSLTLTDTILLYLNPNSNSRSRSRPRPPTSHHRQVHCTLAQQRCTRPTVILPVADQTLKYEAFEATLHSNTFALGCAIHGVCCVCVCMSVRVYPVIVENCGISVGP